MRIIIRKLLKRLGAHYSDVTMETGLQVGEKIPNGRKIIALGFFSLHYYLENDIQKAKL